MKTLHGTAGSRWMPSSGTVSLTGGIQKFLDGQGRLLICYLLVFGVKPQAHNPFRADLDVKVKVLPLYSAARPDGFSSTLQPYPWQGTHPSLVWAITLRWSEQMGSLHHAGLTPSICPPYVFASPNFTPWYGEASQCFKETCSASPPAAVMVETAVGIEPGPPAYKPCLLTTTLPQLTIISPVVWFWSNVATVTASPWLIRGQRSLGSGCWWWLVVG